jgi:hypothetical protein
LYRIEQNITKARRTAYSLLSTGFYGKNGLDPITSISLQKSAKLARNVHWMVLYQICVFGADLKSNMAARVHNVFSLAEILKIFLSETTKSIEL